MTDFTNFGIRVDSTQVRNASRDLDSMSKSSAGLSKNILSTNSALKSLVGTLSLLGLANTALRIISVADKMTLLESRLRVATKTTEDYVKANALLLDMSLRTGTSFEANTTIFFRTNKAIESMGGTIYETARFTETLTKSLIISGATAGETNSVIRQMSQALASGVLRGDEFNSVAENGARLQQLLKDSLHLTAGELREWSETGRLSSDKVFNAVLRGTKAIDEEFAKIPVTVGRAVQNVNTAFTQYVHLVNKGSGATADLAGWIDALANNITPILNSFIELGKVIVVAFGLSAIKSAVNFSAQLAETANKASMLNRALADNAAFDARIRNELLLAQATMGTVEANKAKIIHETQALNTAANTIEANINIATSEVNRAKATIAATEATVQNSGSAYLNRKAKEELALAEEKVAAASLELQAIRDNELIQSEALTFANQAEANAKDTLATATSRADRVNAVSANASAALNQQLAHTTIAAKLAAKAMWLLNNALYAFIAYKVGEWVGKWLSGFQNMRTGAAKLAGATLIVLQDLTYGWERMMIKMGLSKKTLFDLDSEYVRNNAILRQTIEENVKYSGSLAGSNKGMILSARLSKELAERDAEKAAAAKKTAEAIADETEALMDEYVQLSVNARAYKEYTLQKTGATPERIAELLNLWDKNRALEAEADALGKSGKATKEVNNDGKDYINNLIDQNLQLTMTTRNFELLRMSKLDMTEADQLAAIAIWDANNGLIENNKLLEENKRIMDGVLTPTEKFNKAMLSITQNFNKAGGISLKTYNRALDKQIKLLKDGSKEADKHADSQKEIAAYLNDVSATSLDIFTGPAKDMMTMVTAITAMSDALEVNSKFVVKNQEDWKNFNDVNMDFSGPLQETEKFYKQDEELSKKNTDIKIQGITLVGNAVVGMLNEQANAAEEGSKKQIALQAAALAVQAVMAVSLGVLAILTALTGEPNSALARAAITAVVVATQLASIGVQAAGLGGGGGGGGVPELQKTQGTGTVLGDPTAVSESLGNSQDILEEYASIGNEHTSKMLAVLVSIDATLKSTATGIYRSELFNQYSNNPYGIGTLTAGEGSLFGNNKKPSASGQNFHSASGKNFNVKDTGIDFNEITTFGEAFRDGITVEYYAIVDEWKKTMWFFRTGSRTNEYKGDAEQEVNAWFSDIFSGIYEATVEGLQILSTDTYDQIVEAVGNVEIGIDRISLKDMTADEINEALSGVFSAAADDLIYKVAPQLREFQQTGEGLFETFTRVASETENARTILSQLGLTAIDYTDVLYKQNDVGPQIIRQTILMNTQFDNVAKVMQSLAGDAEELFTTWLELRSIQQSLIGIGAGNETNLAKFIGASGGTGGAQSNLDSYIEDFLSPVDAFDIHLSQLQGSFELLGHTMPTSKQGFIDLVNGIDSTTEEGAILLANILSLADASASLSDEYDNLINSTDGAAEKAAELASILAGVASDFAALDNSALQNTLIGIKDNFIQTIEAVIEAGGSFNDIMTVANTGLQTGLRAVRDARISLDNAFAALGKTITDRQRSISLDIMKLSGGDVAGAQKAYYQNILATGDFDAQMDAASQLQSLIMSNYDEQVGALESIEDYIKGIKEYIDSLKLNEQLSILTPQQMLAEAESQYQTTLALANSGDADALSRITQATDEYLNKARAFYASGDQYTAIFNDVIAALDAITQPDAIDNSAITAAASQQAVSELQGISNILNDIRGQSTSQYNEDVLTLEQEALDVYASYIEEISKLTNATAASTKHDLELFGTGGIYDQTIRELLAANVGNTAALKYLADVYGVSASDIDRAAGYASGSTAQFVGESGLAPLTGISDAEVKAFVDANLSDTMAIYNAAIQYGVTSEQLARATGWKQSDILSWAAANGKEPFAKGGIANTASIFGEAGPEAAVPLPDGRSIPVTLSGNGNSASRQSYAELIAEVKGLRADMAEQNGAIIESNYDANDRASERISRVTREQGENMQWRNNKVDVA